MIDFDWVWRHLDDVAERSTEHIQLTVIAVLVGLLISLPLALAAHRYPRIYPPITWTTGLIYTIPSLATFAFLVPYTGLSTLTAEIGLVGYTLLILVRNIYVGLRDVAPEVLEAARGMGFSRAQLLWKVELPLALPAIVAGIRIATVTTVGLVTIAALIGKGGVGYFILLGFDRSFATASLLGSVLATLIAVTFDLGLLGLEKLAVPWARRAASEAAA